MRTPSRSSRLVVVSTLGLLTASAGTATPPNTAPNPPPPRPAPTYAQRGALLNPKDAENRQIYVSSDGSCYVHLPFPPGAQPMPGMSPPRQAVACPPAAQGPEWQACAGGSLHRAVEEGEGCICAQTGNPPPPLRWVACPASAATPED